MASFIGVDLADGLAEACAEGVLLSADFADGIAEAFAQGLEAVLLKDVPADSVDFASDCFPLFALISGEGDGS